MSETILKAVAQAIAELEKKLDDQVVDIKLKVSEIPIGASVETIAILIDEVKSMYTNLHNETNEAQQILLNKTGFVDQELRKLICDEATSVRIVLSDSIERLYSDIAHLSKVEASVLEKSDELNNGTLVLLDIAVDSLTKKISSSVENTDVKLESITDSIEVTNKNLQVTVDEISDLQEELSKIKDVAGYIGCDGLGVNTKTWSAGIYRAGCTVQHFLGQHWTAKCDTHSEPGLDDTWQRVGTFGFKHCGVFDEEACYTQGDMYIKDFGTFLVVDEQRTVLLAGRGPNGKKGEKGDASQVAGPQGAAGISIKQVISSEEGFVLEMTDNSMHTIMYPENIITVSKIKTMFDSATDFESLKSIFATL